MRRERPELRSGDFTNFYAQGAIYAYLRSQGAAQALVVINNGDVDFEKPLPVGSRLAAGSHWQGLLGPETASENAQQLSGLHLKARSAAVLSLQG